MRWWVIIVLIATAIFIGLEFKAVSADPTSVVIFGRTYAVDRDKCSPCTEFFPQPRNSYLVIYKAKLAVLAILIPRAQHPA
jgi:hypothetical protein